MYHIESFMVAIVTWYLSLSQFRILLINNIYSFTGFSTRVTWWEPLMKQELLVFLEHLSSPRFSGVRMTDSLVFCVVSGRRPLLIVLSFIIWPLNWLSVFELRLLIIPFWYLQTFLNIWNPKWSLMMESNNLN